MPAPIRFATDKALTQPPAWSGQHDQDNISKAEQHENAVQRRKELQNAGI